MKITGFKEYDTQYYYIDATLISTIPPIFNPIRFMVDTGAQKTTISIKDSMSFILLIPRASVTTTTPAGGIPTSVIYYCGISFDLVQSVHMERMDQVNILNPDLELFLQDPEGMMRIPSVLGMDILSRYYLHFDSTTITLEK